MNIVEQTATGVLVRLRVKARAKSDAVGSVDARGVHLSVRAAPERGKANAAVVTLLARAIGVPKASVSVVSGETSRDKRVLIVGVTVEQVRARLGVA